MIATHAQSLSATSPAPDALAIPATTRQEAAGLMAVALDRFVDLLERLDPDDWGKPTGCTLWNVKEVAAHKAGSLAGFAGWAEFRRQVGPGARRPYRARGMSQLDAMNQIQVDDRADRTPAELIAELREAGPRAVRTCLRLPGPVRALPLPAPPPKGGFMTVAHLTDTILPRDLWMHRVDVAVATGKPFVQTPEHDGRVVALVVRELAQSLARRLDGASVVYELRGPSGGRWRIGRSADPAATIGVDVVDFARLSSGRLAVADVLPRTAIAGDAGLAERALAGTAVLY